jgi:hypothetical protein
MKYEEYPINNFMKTLILKDKYEKPRAVVELLETSRPLVYTPLLYELPRQYKGVETVERGLKLIKLYGEDRIKRYAGKKVIKDEEGNSYFIDREGHLYVARYIPLVEEVPSLEDYAERRERIRNKKIFLTALLAESGIKKYTPFVIEKQYYLTQDGKCRDVRRELAVLLKEEPPLR